MKLIKSQLTIVHFKEHDTYGVKLTKRFLGIPYFSEFLDIASPMWTWKSNKHVSNYCMHFDTASAGHTKDMYLKHLEKLAKKPKPKKLEHQDLWIEDI